MPDLERKDERIVYGMNCTWWDSIHNAAVKTSENAKYPLPCCPHCGSVLFEMENKETFFADVDKYEKNGHPGYRKILEWSQGKCFKNWDEVEKAYKNEHSQGS